MVRPLSVRLFKAVVVSALFGAVLVPLPATAAGPDCGASGSDGSTIDIGCETGGSDSDGGNDPVYTVPGPWTDYYYVPNCSGNGPPGESFDALCNGAVSTCDEGEIRYLVYTREMGADNQPTGDWESQSGTVCRGSDDPVEGGPPVITEFMIRDAAQQAAPTPSIVAEPAARSYVNVPTNFYTEGDPVDVDVQVLGITITVRFTPTDSSTWSFGDGGTGSGIGIKGADIGAPGAVEHPYARQGDYEITLTQTYDVTATLPGGEVLTLDAPLTGTSEPYALDVGEIQSVVTRVR